VTQLAAGRGTQLAGRGSGLAWWVVVAQEMCTDPAPGTLVCSVDVVGTASHRRYTGVWQCRQRASSTLSCAELGLIIIECVLSSYRACCCMDLCRWLARILRIGAFADTSAVLLHMGEFWVPQLCADKDLVAATTLRLAGGSGRTAALDLGVGADITTVPQAAPVGRLDWPAAVDIPIQAAASAAVTVTGCEGGAGGPLQAQCAPLQLHSVTARPLCTRLKCWASQLNYLPGTRQLARGYFEAPGAAIMRATTCRCSVHLNARRA